MKAVIIMGSESDLEFAQKIINHLENISINYDVNTASAHKQPLEVLNIIQSNDNEKGVVYIFQSPLVAKLFGNMSSLWHGHSLWWHLSTLK